MIAAIETALGPAVVGLDPFDLAEAHRRMDLAMSGNSSAKCAVDIALHDLAGRLSGQPVSRLLGGAPRGPIASSKAVSVGTTKSMVAEAKAFVDAGFGTLKIKTGVDAGSELAAIAAIRDRVGPGIRLKLDANQGWTLPQATRFLAAAEPYDIEMVEQPLAAWDLKGHAELRRRTPIPLMLDEGVHSARDALRAIDAGATDYVNIKLLKTGGLAPARDLAAVCAAAGVACQIGTLDSSIGSAAAAHLEHACPIIRYAEINGPSRAENDFASGFVVADGTAMVPDGPGLGVTVDMAAIEGGAG
jgi:L-alanine-DL-glutamate epimerase-like enolase superfamily enzyme